MKVLTFEEISERINRQNYNYKMELFKKEECFCRNRKPTGKPKLYHFAMDKEYKEFDYIVMHCDICLPKSRFAFEPQRYVEFTEKEYFLVSIL